MLIEPAYAQAAGGGDMISAFLPIIPIFVIFYFLLIRPQQKKQKQHRQKLDAVRRGDQVLLGGGIYGKVVKVYDDGDLDVDLGGDMTVRVLKATLMDVMSKPEPASSKNSASSKSAGKSAGAAPKRRRTPAKKKAAETKADDGAESGGDAGGKD